jgi:TRAP-type transport system periplasmic protein
MRYSKSNQVFLAISLFLCGALSAQSVSLKMASQAPESSPIGQGLAKLAAEWSRVSGGTVKLKIYHGGSLGDEESFRQKMNTGLLDAGVFTSQGMSAVVPEFLSFSAPSLFASQDEFNYALDKLGPELRHKLEEHGMIALGLAPSGWIRIFSRTPVASPEDLRKVKLGINPYDNALIQFFKLMDMNIVTVQPSLLLQKMQAKSVDAFYTSPVYFSYQWTSYQGIISSMTDVRLAPFMGCLAMRKQSWEKVPERYRQALLDATARVAKEIESEMMAKEDSIITDLGAHGLNVVKPTARQAEEWQKTFSEGLSTNDSLKLFPPEMIGKIRKVVADYRAGKR